MGGFNVEFPKLWVPTPKLDGYVVGWTRGWSTRAGRPVTIRDVMLHHVVFYKRDRARVAVGVRGQVAGGVLRHRRGEAAAAAARGLRLSGAKARALEDERDADVPLAALGEGARRVHGDDRDGQALEPVIPLWVRANGCGDAVSYPVWGGGGPGATDTRTLRLARAVRRADRRGRRAPARRREGHVALPAAMRRTAAPGHHAALRDARQPLLHGAPDPARAGTGRHALLPVADRHPGAPRRDADG